MNYSKKNIFSFDENDFESEEIFETLAQGGGAKIERICSKEYENGRWYDQPEDEFVMLLKGEAKLEFGDGSLEMESGDYLTISAHSRHRVARASDGCVWLAVFGKFD